MNKVKCIMSLEMQYYNSTKHPHFKEEEVYDFRYGDETKCFVFIRYLKDEYMLDEDTFKSHFDIIEEMEELNDVEKAINQLQETIKESNKCIEALLAILEKPRPSLFEESNKKDKE